MARTTRERIPVRWIDAKTGEDITDRMLNPADPPGEGMLALAQALGRLMAAQQVEAEHQLLGDARARIAAQPDELTRSRTPQVGDELILNKVSYRYDGSTDDADHFTRLDGERQPEALVSLRRRSPEAHWVLQQLERQQ
jgi:hypothetical protein